MQNILISGGGKEHGIKENRRYVIIYNRKNWKKRWFTNRINKRNSIIKIRIKRKSQIVNFS